MEDRSGMLMEGARRVWRHRRILWWLFALNLALGAMGTLSAEMSVARVTDHSLYSDRLYTGFDVTAFFELTQNPDVKLWSNLPEPVLFAGIFLAFALFVNGGILESYRVDRRLTMGEFFQACGWFFWRWVRLLIMTLVVLLPIVLLAGDIHKWSHTLAADSPREKLGFWVEVAGMLLMLFLTMVVRLWFDMAQIRMVAEREFSVLRSLVGSFRLMAGNLVSLFWLYARISGLAWLGLGVGVVLWSKIPATDIGFSFLLWEIVLLWWGGTRLWQRASETVWYERGSVVSLVPVNPVLLPLVTPASAEAPPV